VVHFLAAPGFASPSPLFFFIEGSHVVLTGWSYTLGMQWLACHIQQTVFDDLKDAKLTTGCHELPGCVGGAVCGKQEPELGKQQHDRCVNDPRFYSLSIFFAW
jgi:hypothetical protein